MAMAPVVYVLWQEFLRFDPEDPIWPNRDRFILSAGHASTLLYSLLHLAGVKAVNRKYETLGELAVPLDDLKNFRQLESKCPGHPEYRWTSGVETTTGPLGQGVATSVGIALASKWLAERYNRPNFPMFDYDVYALAGDGCMMEGISSEAASLAGHLRLSNLCWIYDNNHITIEGNTSLAFSEDVAGRFLAYGWNVQRVSNANDLDLLREAFDHFKKTTDRPTLIIVDSHIAYGAPTKQDTSAAHGEPLGEDEGSLRLAPAPGLRHGAYVLSDATDGKPNVLLIATGSEVSLCVDAQAALKQQGVEARVVSMPSWELFEQQDEAYRESVLPSDIKARVSVEKASRFGWERYVGLEGDRIGMKTFGASAPLKELQKKFGFTVDAVVSAAREQVNRVTR